ncbi:fibroblast growth factor 23-like [Leuresthes tenuis]|uniref:fibroblast growth factor 23-like n=1 Tax=Leuresthes tenuis TaxID=355514 RepID=UPI003B50E518
MQQAFFSLIFISAHVSVTVDCRPGLQDPQHQTRRFNTETDAETSAGTGPFYLELNGSMRKGRRGLLVIMPVRTATSNFVSIFDVRRRQFLCVDFRGELYKSWQRDRWDCLFQRIWLDVEHHHDVFYSTSGKQLLTLGGGELRVAQQKHPSIKRRRRSEEVNPSDPLRSESHPSLSAKDAELGQPELELEQPGAVSKETITSCDDPLRVLRPNGHGSPVKTNIADRAEHE